MGKTEIQLGARKVLIDNQLLPLWERMQKLRSEVNQKQAQLVDMDVNTTTYQEAMAQMQVMHGEIQRLHRQLIVKAQ